MGGIRDIEEAVRTICRDARQAARRLRTVPTHVKNDALRSAATGLRERAGELLDANRADLLAAREADLSAALIDRLTLSQSRVEAMAEGLDQVAALSDPLGETIAHWRRPNGLEITQVRIALGVVGVIYESRPNVTADAAGLCLKSGNAVVLKGGSEAFATNRAIARVIAEAVAAVDVPATAVQFIPTTDLNANSELSRHLSGASYRFERPGP